MSTLTLNLEHSNATSSGLDYPLPQVLTLPVTMIDPDPEQPRRQFGKQQLDELKDSIEKHGLLQPLVVRPRTGPGNRGRYWIVAGERRYRAARDLGMQEIPCTVHNYTNVQALVISLAENLHREDLDAVEKSEALHRLRRITDKSWEEIAELVRLSESHVKTLARLEKLDDEVKQLVRDHTLSDRKAIALLPLPPARQREVAQEALAQELTAEQIREKVQEILPRSITRNTQAPELPVEQLLPPETGSKGGSVTREHLGPIAMVIRGFTESLKRIDQWLNSRTWSPSQVSESQQKLIDELYHAASTLQQSLISIRNGWRFRAEGEPDLRLRGSAFPF